MPDNRALLEVLRAYEVRFVLVGSVAGQAWVAEVGLAGDIDIIPDTSRPNLARMAGVLTAINAEAFPVTGEWISPDGEAVWVEFAGTDPRRQLLLPSPDPAAIKTIDSLFRTRFDTRGSVERDSVGTLRIWNLMICRPKHRLCELLAIILR